MPKLGSAEKTAAVPRVGYLVYRVERRLRARLDEEMRVHGVSTPEYVTLSLLRERDGLSCAQLARWALVTPQAMNLVISGLERRRLVRRRPDPKHRRVLRASVTTKGLEVLDRCDRSMDRIEADMLGDLPPETVEVVRAAMASFAHSLAGDESASTPPSAGFTGRVAVGPGMASSAAGVSDASLYSGLFAHGDVADAVERSRARGRDGRVRGRAAAGAGGLWSLPRSRRRTSSRRLFTAEGSTSIWPSLGEPPGIRARRSQDCCARSAGSSHRARPRTSTRARRARTWSTPR